MSRFVERALPLLAFALVSLYVYGFFTRMPYLGFRYAADGTVTQVFVEAQPWLVPGDRILHVGDTPWEVYQQDLRRAIFPRLQAGAEISLLIEREGNPQTVAWRVSETTTHEFLERLNSQWWLAYIFWIGGTATLLLVRPKDALWKLLVASNYLTAIWLAVGSGPSLTHLWGAALWLRSLTWVMAPVFLHLHWAFPHHWRRLPTALLWAGSVLAVSLALAQWLQWLPANAYLAGFLLMTGGSVLILAAKYTFQPKQRRDIGFLVLALLLIFVPGVVTAFGDMLFGRTTHAFAQAGTLLAFPALPGAYFYVVYRRQLGELRRRAERLPWLYVGLIAFSSLTILFISRIQPWHSAPEDLLAVGAPLILLGLIIATTSFLPFLALPALSGAMYFSDQRTHELELRANQLLIPYLFFVLLGIVLVGVLSLVDASLDFPGETLLAGLCAGFLAAGVSVGGYRRFHRFAEHHLLGIPLASTGLIKRYATRITTTLDREDLARLLTEEVLPSLLVRQSALVYFEATGNPAALYLQGVMERDLPDWDEFQENDFQNDRVTPPLAGWVHLFFRLQLAERPVGLWLLGRRDPDDFYARNELPMFQALADQTTIALANIIQAGQLRALYQANMDRQETERANLARELHDQVLNQLADLLMKIETERPRAELLGSYETVTRRLREVVGGLRPGTLNYGLRLALDELADELSERRGETQVQVDVPPSPARYDPRVEVHLYRIVQQACENALRHAWAKLIRITGELNPAGGHLVVEDDGQGFDHQTLNLSELIARKHYGLVGLHERAVLIGATLSIHSSPGNGTRVSVVWKGQEVL